MLAPLAPNILWPTLLALLSLLLLYAAAQLYANIIFPLFFSPLQQLRGPPGKGLFAQQLMEIMEPELSPYYHDQYVKAYGKTFRIYGFGKFDPRLLTLDPRAMLHILNNPHTYPKPWQSRRLISDIIGNGLFASEGPAHDRQRKVVRPAFSHQNLQALSPIFTEKALELRDIWLSLLGTEDSATIDVAHWISRATFDIIGLAGFDYAFDALQTESNPVYLAYKEMFDVALNRGFSVRTLVGVFLPFINWVLPDERTRTIRRSHEVIYGVGRRLLETKTAEVMRAKQLEGPPGLAGPHSKDLLTLLITSNLAPDLPPSQRISATSILAQLNSFFFAGSDSTSLALTHTLHLLSLHPSLQTRLRTSLLPLPSPSPFHTIDALPLLDHVCRESLRLVPPVHSSLRVAAREDVVPLSEPVLLKNGRTAREVRVPKGTFVHVPIEGFNLLTDVWGADAHEFNPDRWDDLPPAVRAQPGIYANIMSFSAGPRACIGQRFSIIEMKTLLFHLVRTFEFARAEEIVRRNFVLTRPFVRGRVGEGPQLPLVVRRVE